jgi:hypothetical protein
LYIEEDKKIVEENGYKKNRDYRCDIKETGEISESFFDTAYSFYYSDLAELEEAIQKAKADLTVTLIPHTKPKLHFTDYLHHSNKEALMQKLHELLDGKKGREVAKVLMALEDKRYLIIPTKKLDEVRKCMIPVIFPQSTKFWKYLKPDRK